jgi:hypothetical protein
MAVDQGQRRARTQPAQVDRAAQAEVVAGITVNAEIGHIGTIGAATEILRQLLEQLLQGGHTGAVDDLPVDHDDRRCTTADGIADVAANHQHLVQGGRGRVIGGARVLRLGLRSDLQRSSNARRQQRAPTAHEYLFHSPVHHSHPISACGTVTCA